MYIKTCFWPSPALSRPCPILKMNWLKAISRCIHIRFQMFCVCAVVGYSGLCFYAVMCSVFCFYAMTCSVFSVSMQWCVPWFLFLCRDVFRGFGFYAVICSVFSVSIQWHVPCFLFLYSDVFRVFCFYTVTSSVSLTVKAVDSCVGSHITSNQKTLLSFILLSVLMFVGRTTP